MKKEIQKKKKEGSVLLVIAFAFMLFSLGFVLSVNPTGPDSMVYGDNLTKSTVNPVMVNISGGIISKFNLTATIQNPRWKAFVGDIVATFTLDDDSQNTIYDWSLDSVSGRVYASRTNTVTWTGIDCASTAQLEAENLAMSQTGSSDNITATFKNTTHDGFYTGAKAFVADECSHTLNTYVSDSAQDTDYDEVALIDTGANLVYATIISQGATGFDGNNYDFQMIVPENGSAGFSGATPYYLYVEISN